MLKRGSLREGGGAAGGRVVTGDIRGGPAEQASGHSVGPLRKPRPGLNMLNKVSQDGRSITISWTQDGRKIFS